ncbi:unnamed protein product, partial [Ectocarpus fasciculatus]
VLLLPLLLLLLVLLLPPFPPRRDSPPPQQHSQLPPPGRARRGLRQDAPHVPHRPGGRRVPRHQRLQRLLGRKLEVCVGRGGHLLLRGTPRRRGRGHEGSGGLAHGRS